MVYFIVILARLLVKLYLDQETAKWRWICQVSLLCPWESHLTECLYV